MNKNCSALFLLFTILFSISLFSMDVVDDASDFNLGVTDSIAQNRPLGRTSSYVRSSCKYVGTVVGSLGVGLLIDSYLPKSHGYIEKTVRPALSLVQKIVPALALGHFAKPVYQDVRSALHGLVAESIATAAQSGRGQLVKLLAEFVETDEEVVEADEDELETVREPELKELIHQFGGKIEELRDAYIKAVGDGLRDQIRLVTEEQKPELLEMVREIKEELKETERHLVGNLVGGAASDAVDGVGSAFTAAGKGVVSSAGFVGRLLGNLFKRNKKRGGHLDSSEASSAPAKQEGGFTREDLRTALVETVHGEFPRDGEQAEALFDSVWEEIDVNGESKKARAGGLDLLKTLYESKSEEEVEEYSSSDVLIPLNDRTQFDGGDLPHDES